MVGLGALRICRIGCNMDLKEQYKILDGEESEPENELDAIATIQKQIREIIDDPESDESLLTLLKDKLKSLQYEQGI